MAAHPRLYLGPDNPEVRFIRAGASSDDSAAADAGGVPSSSTASAAKAPQQHHCDRRRRVFVALLAVHGDEPCGVAAANRLIEEGFFEAAAAALDCCFDELRLVVGNPKALAAGRRQVDFNLNRAFTPSLLEQGRRQLQKEQQQQQKQEQEGAAGVPEAAAGSEAAGATETAAAARYELARAAQLAPLLEGATRLLDLHSTSAPTPPFAFYVPSRATAAAAAAAVAAAAAAAQGQAQAAQQGDPPPEAALALSLPVAYAVRDYTGAGLGLAVEHCFEACGGHDWAAGTTSSSGNSGGGGDGAGAVVTALPLVACVECGEHAAPEAVAAAEACLRAFAWPSRYAVGGGAEPPPPPRHVVARAGVTVRPGFRWAWRQQDDGPPPAFAAVAHGEVVAVDDGGPIACPCANGGALIFMPAVRPIVGEDALLWAEDCWPAAAQQPRG